MIYITCPTCGYFIGSKAIQYDTQKAIICSNTETTEEERAEQIQQLLTEIQELRKAGEIKTMVQELEMELIRKEERIQVQLSHLQQEVNRLSHL